MCIDAAQSFCPSQEADPLLLEAGDPEGQESSEESTKEDGWITPRNIEQIQQSTCWGSQPAKVQVGCVTTDFAMQASRRSVKPASPLFIPVGPCRDLAPPDLPFSCLP